jgi:hypothetical protein
MWLKQLNVFGFNVYKIDINIFYILLSTVKWKEILITGIIQLNVYFYLILQIIQYFY